jgi:hypothetical protein
LLSDLLPPIEFLGSSLSAEVFLFSFRVGYFEYGIESRQVQHFAHRGNNDSEILFRPDDAGENRAVAEELDTSDRWVGIVWEFDHLAADYRYHRGLRFWLVCVRYAELDNAGHGYSCGPFLQLLTPTLGKCFG